MRPSAILTRARGRLRDSRPRFTVSLGESEEIVRRFRHACATGNVEELMAVLGLDRGLLDLVRMRASQINGCAYCPDMHSKVARANRETEQRLYGLDAWRETPYPSSDQSASWSGGPMNRT